MTKRYSHPTPDHKRKSIEFLKINIQDVTSHEEKEKITLDHMINM